MITPTLYMARTEFLKGKTKTFFKRKDMRAREERIDYRHSLNEHFLGVMIEQGMLGKNGAARSITPGNEVVCKDPSESPSKCYGLQSWTPLLNSLS